MLFICSDPSLLPTGRCDWWKKTSFRENNKVDASFINRIVDLRVRPDIIHRWGSCVRAAMSA